MEPPAEARRLGWAHVWLRVVPDNEPALSRHVSAGFRRATPDEESAFNVGQPVEYVCDGRAAFVGRGLTARPISRLGALTASPGWSEGWGEQRQRCQQDADAGQRDRPAQAQDGRREQPAGESPERCDAPHDEPHRGVDPAVQSVGEVATRRLTCVTLKTIRTKPSRNSLATRTAIASRAGPPARDQQPGHPGQ